LDWTPYFDTVTPGLLLPNENLILVTNLVFLQNFKSFINSQPPATVYRFLQFKVWQFIVDVNLTKCWLETPDRDCLEIFEIVNDFTQADICAEIVHLVLTDYVGLLFTLEVVNEDLLNDIRNLTLNVQGAFNASLPTLPWLDSQSRASVIYKLQNIIQNIGHPNKLERYAGVKLYPDAYFANIISISQAVLIDQAKGWRLPFNRSDDEFDPMEVNAFYDPDTNSINFPAGILESPMFSATWPALFQYARIGYVIGHENTHGFDNEGSRYGPDGFPGDIFDSATRAQFLNHSTCIANLYSKYIVYGNVPLNGVQTLGENIADIGGIKNAYRAYQKYVATYGPEFPDGAVLAGFTTNQVFWIILGQTWCSVQNDAYLKLQVARDPHSPSKFRINGPLSQFDQFATDFNCAAGAPMNPSDRCTLW